MHVHVQVIKPASLQLGSACCGIDKLITQPWPIRAEIARYAAAQCQDANARNRKNL